MREVTIREAIQELELPCEVRKAPSNIPYILYKDINGKTVAVRRRKADGSLGFWTTLSVEQRCIFMEKTTEMKRVKLNKLKQGDYFKLNPTETAPVWVRGEYDKMCKRYSCYHYNDVNHENFMKGDRNVYIDFEF